MATWRVVDGGPCEKSNRFVLSCSSAIDSLQLLYGPSQSLSIGNEGSMASGGGGGWYVLNVDIVDSRRVGISLTNICLSVLTSTSYGEYSGYMVAYCECEVCICALYAV